MRKRQMLPGLLIGGLLLLGGGWWIGVATSLTTHQAAALAVSVTQTTGASTDFAGRVISRTNMYRTQHGCPAVTPNAALTRAAQAHSEDMATHDFTGHNDSNGVTLGNRIRAAGYSYVMLGENIAWGQQSPEQVVDMWFNETPPNDAHRQNILNCAFRDIGVGYVYLANDPGNITAHYYWTEDFGILAKPAPTATPKRTPTPKR
jgi:uncharacterized protein YkwD